MGCRARSTHLPNAKDPAPMPKRKTASIALNEYVVDPKTRISVRNHSTSKPSATMPASPRRRIRPFADDTRHERLR